MRDVIVYTTLLALLYEILYNQTGNRLHRAARKLFIIAAATATSIEIASLI